MKFESFPNKISLSSPTMYGDEIKYLDSLFHPNEQSNIIEIEKMISEITGRKYAIPVSNGTSALHLAVKLSGVKQNDVVLCSTMTFVASANPILYEKAKPVFVDVEYDTWNMSPKALEKAFEKYPKAKAIIVTDLYGTSANYSEIQRIAKNYGVTIIQDAAESFGTKYKEKDVQWREFFFKTTNESDGKFKSEWNDLVEGESGFFIYPLCSSTSLSPDTLEKIKTMLNNQEK